MLCPNCEYKNPENSEFCNQCGQALPLNKKPKYPVYCVVYKSNYKDSYNTNFVFSPCPADALARYNKLTPFPNHEHFLAQVEDADLLPEDSKTFIVLRFKVIRWWKLTKNNSSWITGEELKEKP